MGKNGLALRMAKQKNRTYTFTKEQLELHDEFVRKEYKDRVVNMAHQHAMEEIEKHNIEVQELVQKEWDERKKEFYTDDAEDNFYNLLSYMLSVSVRVLVEKFGWKPLPENQSYNKRNRLMRFADYLVDEIDKISSDETLDIRQYSEETYKLYRIKFNRGTE